MNPLLAHIVDDDEAIRDALTWLLRTRNVASRTWSSAEEFLAAGSLTSMAASCWTSGCAR
jgi:two-component system response regulator DctR